MAESTTSVARGALIASGALAAAALLAFQPAAGIAQTFDLKIGYATTHDPQHDLGGQIVKLLAERTNGKIKGRLFPASQLGKIPRQVEGLQLGTQEMFLTPPGFLVGLNPAFQVTDAPGLFESHAHAQRAVTWPKFRDKFLKLAESKGIVGGGVWIYDATAIASVKPIRTLADFRGKKLRVLATKMEAAFVDAFGAAGVPMPYTDVLPSMQRGTIDGVRSSTVVMGASKFFTVAKYITMTGGGYIASGEWISKAWLNRLPSNLRKIVMDTCLELEDWAGKNAMAYAKRAEQVWRDNGAEVIRLSPAEQKEYISRVNPLGDRFLGKNPATKDMYALLKEAVAATR